MYEYDVTVTRGSTSLKVKIETDISHESPRALYPQEISSRFVGLSKEELTKFLGGGWSMYFETKRYKIDPVVRSGGEFRALRDWN
ncbi:MAG: hypothetical protein DMG06_12625 [Acidobacteria bacterium]|nr:MAG: hypothetical protein DMG06_12625 [Acidobacteriota bacterium]